MNFNDFCFHFGSQNPSKKQSPLDIFATISPRHVQDAPKTPQDASKTTPRRLEDPPRSLEDGSKTPKMPPRRLWTAQRRFQAASSCRETPQENYKFERFEKSLNFSVFHPIFNNFSRFQASNGEERADPSE